MFALPSAEVVDGADGQGPMISPSLADSNWR